MDLYDTCFYWGIEILYLRSRELKINVSILTLAITRRIIACDRPKTSQNANSGYTKNISFSSINIDFTFYRKELKTLEIINNDTKQYKLKRHKSCKM